MKTLRFYFFFFSVALIFSPVVLLHAAASRTEQAEESIEHAEQKNSGIGSAIITAVKAVVVGAVVVIVTVVGTVALLDYASGGEISRSIKEQWNAGMREYYKAKIEWRAQQQPKDFWETVSLFKAAAEDRKRLGQYL